MYWPNFYHYFSFTIQPGTGIDCLKSKAKTESVHNPARLNLENNLISNAMKSAAKNIQGRGTQVQKPCHQSDSGSDQRAAGV